VEVLHQGDLSVALALVEDDRHLPYACLPRGRKATMPCDHGRAPIAVIPYEQRLEYPVPRDARGEPVERPGVLAGPWN
jgi:hypothetical protein